MSSCVDVVGVAAAAVVSAGLTHGLERLKPRTQNF